MAVKIKPLRKFTTGTPTTSDMVEGEIAVNTADKKVFMRDDANNVIEVGAASSLSLPIGGGTLTGDVILNSDSVTLPSFGGGTNEGALQVFTSEITATNLWDDINSDGNNFSSMPSEISVSNVGNNTTNSFAGLFMMAGETSDNNSVNAARIGAIREGAGKQTALGFAVRQTGGDMVEVGRFKSTKQFNITGDIELEGSSYITTLSKTAPTAARTITFPDATGTVALTSDLSSYALTSALSNYLPIAGGTVTGALGVDGNATLGNATTDDHTINGTLSILSTTNEQNFLLKTTFASGTDNSPDFGIYNNSTQSGTDNNLGVIQFFSDTANYTQHQFADVIGMALQTGNAATEGGIKYRFASGANQSWGSNKEMVFRPEKIQYSNGTSTTTLAYTTPTSGNVTITLPNTTGTVALTNDPNFAPIASPTFTGTVTTPILRITGTTDASLSSTAHGFQVGATSGTNVIIDGNEIMARNNSAASGLYLQNEGGAFEVGKAADNSTIKLYGRTTIFDGNLSLPSISGDGYEAALTVVTSSIDADNLWDDINSDGNNYSSMPSEIAIKNLGNNTTNSFAGIFMMPGETSDASYMNAARIGAIREGAGRQTAIGFATRQTGGDMVEVGRFKSTKQFNLTGDIELEGASYITTLTKTAPTAARTITFPDSTGEVLVKNTNDDVNVISTNAGSTSDPNISLIRRSATPAQWDYLGAISSFGYDSNANADVAYGSLVFRISNVTNGSHEGALNLFLANSGSNTWNLAYYKDKLQFGAEQTIEWYQHKGTNYDCTLDWTTPTADRTVTFPNATGTVALTSDIPSLSGYALLSGANFTGDITVKTSTGGLLTLQTSDTTVGDGDVLGALQFQAPNEADGSDGALVSASIVAEADATFDATTNSTDLVFKLGTDGAVTEKARLTHEGNLQLTYSADDQYVGPGLYLDRDSASPAVNDYIGSLIFRGNDSGGTMRTYATIYGRILDPTAGAHHSRLQFHFPNPSATNTYSIGLDYDYLHFETEQLIRWHNHKGTTYECDLDWTTPTANRTVTFPDKTGTVVVQTSDTDDTVDLGRAKISSSLATDIAFFSHYDQNVAGGFALAQNSAGSTFVNAPTGQGVNFNINDTLVTQIYGDGLYMAGGKTIMFEGATVDTADTILTVTDPTATRTITLPDATGTVLTTGNPEINGAYGSSSAPRIFKVTVAAQTAAHPYNGDGSTDKFSIDGIQGAALTLHGADNVTANSEYVYRFDQADSTNANHPLRFYLDAAKTTAYTTGVTTNGTPGQAGAYTQIAVDQDTPQILYYQCSSHDYMGNYVIVPHSTNIKQNQGNITFDAVGGNIALTQDTGNMTFTNTGSNTDITFTTNGSGVLKHNTNTVLTLGNSDAPTTTTSDGDADFVLIDDGGTMKKITPANLGIGSGGGGVTVQDEGGALSTTGTTLNFVGAGVVASGTGATKTITISGGGSGITVQDEGSALSTAGTTLNFVGAGVTASGTGATKTITISGGGGGGASIGKILAMSHFMG